MTAYFEKEGAGNPARTGVAGQDIWFDQYEVRAGCAYGVLAVTDDAQIAALRNLAQAPQHGVWEISKERYEACTKKKPRAWQPRPVGPVSSTPAAIQGAGAAVVASEPQSRPEPAPATLQAAEAILAGQLGKAV